MPEYGRSLWNRVETPDEVLDSWPPAQPLTDRAQRERRCRVEAPLCRLCNRVDLSNDVSCNQNSEWPLGWKQLETVMAWESRSKLPEPKKTYVRRGQWRQANEAHPKPRQM